MKTLRRVLGLALLPLLATTAAWGWGSDGHRMINRLAMESLPADTPAFLRNAHALDTVEYLGPEPDRWRNKAETELESAQAPDHFIDFENADLVGVLPRERYDFIARLAIAQAAHPGLQLAPTKVGLQPWQVEEVWERLKVDFREYRKLTQSDADTGPVRVAILYDCGWLGHYVGDGAQPLHTTVQYNGWTGLNPHGYNTSHEIHWAFEGVYVGANLRAADVEPLVASAPVTPIQDEWAQYLDYLRHSHTLVEQVYRLDKEGGFTGAGTPAAKAFTAERLAAGAVELRDLIESAWVHSADSVQEFSGF